MKRDIIAIGGSAGSNRAVREIVSSLSMDFPATTFVALHRAYIEGVDYVPSALSHLGSQEVILPKHNEPLRRNCVYVSPIGMNLRIFDGLLQLDAAARGATRDSIDVLFRSAAATFGGRVIGIVLSGLLSDGSAGLREIRKHGGITIVQDPTEAPFPSMPRTAMQAVPVDFCLRASEIADRLPNLIDGTSNPAPKTGRIMIVEDDWMLACELRDQLHDFGFPAVTIVASGEEALDRAGLDRPETVIMDVRLSGTMTGTEAAAVLNERFHVPVVFLTAYADNLTLSQAINTQPCAFLAKPYRPSELIFAIQIALERHRQSRFPKDI